MRREYILILCAAALMCGCSPDEVMETSSDASANLQTQSAAIHLRNFGKLGGAPYQAPGYQYPAAPAAEQHFGRQIAILDIRNDGRWDYATSISAGQMKHGEVKVISRDGSLVSEASYRYTTTANTSLPWNYGYHIEAGKFCPNLTKTDIIVASAPDANSDPADLTPGSVYNGTGLAGGFGLIYYDGKNVDTHVRIPSGVAHERAGTTFAIGDADNDGSMDIVYQSGQLVPNGSKAVPKHAVRVLPNFCEFHGTMNASDRIELPYPKIGSSDPGFGSAIYVKDLDGKGIPEIIVVDSGFVKESENTAEGAISFYKKSGSGYVESRPSIVGDLGAGGMSIAAVDFVDINGDGKLDIVAGGPKYQSPIEDGKSFKIEGRVRTYTNAGEGKAFITESPAWERNGGMSNLNFGTALKVVDVNKDGVPDLVVSAKGNRGKQTADGQQSYIYLFLGTKDGTVFSKDPYWSYVSSDTGAEKNEAFGSVFAVADLDGKGWLDFAVGAPDYDKGTIAKSGRITTFMNASAPCYTADKCLITDESGNETCYNEGDNEKDNVCLICDPSKNNFALSPLVCEEDTSNPCLIKSGICAPETGCEEKPAPNGTACGSNSCSDIKTLVTMQCNDGTCVENTTACSVFVCDPSLSSCPTSCKTDSDCQDKTLVCKEGTCAEPNKPPVADLAAAFEGDAGSTIILDASKSNDPNGDSITYTWSGDTDFLSSADSNNPKPEFTIPTDAKPGTVYTLTLTVTDVFGLSDTVKTAITVTGVTNNPPTAIIVSSYSGKPGEQIQLNASRSKDPDGDTLTFKWTGDTTYLSSLTSSRPYFSIPSTASEGTIYHLTITVTDPGGLSGSANTVVNVTAPDNHPPVAIIQNKYEGYAGDNIILDASKSSDPDGNPITYAWSGDTAHLLNATPNNPKPTFHIPADAAPNTTYTLTLTVSDSFGAQAVAAVTVRVLETSYINTPPVAVIDAPSTVTPGLEAALSSKSTDAEDKTLKCIWEFSCSDGSVCGTLNKADNCDAVFIPDTDKEGTVINVVLTVFDKEGLSDSASSSMTVAYIKDAVDIITPEAGAQVNFPVQITGTAKTPNSELTVFNEVNGNIVCTAIADDSGAWTCIANSLTLGTNSIYAEAKMLNSDLVYAKSNVRTFTIIDNIPDPPVIISPVDKSENISITPIIYGTHNRFDGTVIISSISDVSTAVLCQSPVDHAGVWSCTPNEPLAYNTPYIIAATYTSEDGSSESQASKYVHFITEDAVPAISILYPTDGSQVESAEELNIAGTADPNTSLEVYNVASAETLCRTASDDSGHWSCTSTGLAAGEYTIAAFSPENADTVKSAPVSFEVYQAIPHADDSDANVRGGSCAMTPVPQNNLGWLFLAGFAGLGLIIRRRRD